MTELVIEGLRARVGGTEVLQGVDITVRSGEVHAVMGPNGSGKSTLSHVLMGRPGYEVTGGTARLDGVDLLGLETWERAKAGLFLAMQYPIEVPGVSLVDMLESSAVAAGRDRSAVSAELAAEADRIGFDRRFLDRALNVDLSGGEQKRNETLQMGVLNPAIAILDELDSGLDVDGLRTISEHIEAATNATRGDRDPLGVLVITHYSRLLEQLRPDVVHVLAQGRIQTTGGPELADELERTGYAEWTAAPAAASAPDPMADPFADPLA